MNRKTANTVSKADATIITGPRTRLSYAHLFEPHSFTSKDTAKYSSNLLIPKDDKRTLDRIHAAIKAAYELGKNRLLEKDGSIPALKDLTLPLRDGDEEFPDDPAYESMLFMSAKNKYQPTLYDQAGHKITDPSDLYSGCYAKCKIQFYTYKYGNPGIAVSLLGLLKVRDGQALGGSVCTADDFTGDEEEYYDDEDFLS